jgi:hypothetical protein
MRQAEVNPPASKTIAEPLPLHRAPAFPPRVTEVTLSTLVYGLESPGEECFV